MGKDDCIFCKIVRKELPSTIIGETNNFIAILNIHPVAEGHTLVIPKKHFVTLLDIPDSLGQEMLGLCKKIASGFLDEKKGDAFNVVMNNLPPAGQVIEHAHIHIIPRKEKDGLQSIA